MLDSAWDTLDVKSPFINQRISQVRFSSRRSKIKIMLLLEWEIQISTITNQRLQIGYLGNEELRRQDITKADFSLYHRL